MSDAADQPKLLGFSGRHEAPDKVALGEVIRREVLAIKELLGKRMIVVCRAAAGADLIFLKTCVELRIPAIVILSFPEERFATEFADPEECAMAQRLCGVALAKYTDPGEKNAAQSDAAVSRLVLEWADAVLFTRNSEPLEEAVEEAQILGIPSCGIDVHSLAARWETPPDPERGARHGFPTRAELLDFLDARFSAPK